VKDLLSYFPNNAIALFHIPGKTNPADDLSIILTGFRV
jgi:hypothetical protein